MATRYPNIYKAIYSINELINEIVIYKTFPGNLRPLHDKSITLEIIITRYPKVL